MQEGNNRGLKGKENVVLRYNFKKNIINGRNIRKLQD
jgi:hypothetical protein